MRRIHRTILAMGAILALVVGTSLAQAHVNSFTIDRAAQLSTGGTIITVSGRVNCDPFHTFDVDVTVTQGDGQNAEFARGFMGTPATCFGTPQLWEVEADSFSGPFHGGRATVTATVSTFGSDGFDSETVDAVVRLVR